MLKSSLEPQFFDTIDEDEVWIKDSTGKLVKVEVTEDTENDNA